MLAVAFCEPADTSPVMVPVPWYVRPDAKVIAIGTNESITKVMQQLEDGWPGALPRPIYLFADGGRLEELTTATSSNTSLRQRVLGTAPGRKTANYANWATAFNGFHGHAPLTYADTAYDSAYLLAFAVAWLKLFAEFFTLDRRRGPARGLRRAGVVFERIRGKTHATHLNP